MGHAVAERMASRLRRHQALVAMLALFLCAGALALDDYIPSGLDMGAQRGIGNAALDYLAGDGERAFDQLTGPADEYYGAAFEAPLALVERLLGLDAPRDWDLYRVRFLLTHLFFLIGGGFCYLLVLRMFGNRALALLAVALFLLHPRLYAHSFINSKDLPFLAMFMASLYLVHRAFRRETLGAFLLCGVGIGLLVNLRVMGLLLFAAVLVLRALDMVSPSPVNIRGGGGTLMAGDGRNRGGLRAGGHPHVPRLAARAVDRPRRALRGSGRDARLLPE